MIVWLCDCDEQFLTKNDARDVTCPACGAHEGDIAEDTLHGPIEVLGMDDT